MTALKLKGVDLTDCIIIMPAPNLHGVRIVAKMLSLAILILLCWWGGLQRSIPITPGLGPHLL